ncbi:putative minor fimbrial subunit LpfD [compost metagenome]
MHFPPFTPGPRPGASNAPFPAQADLAKRPTASRQRTTRRCWAAAAMLMGLAAEPASAYSCHPVSSSYPYPPVAPHQFSDTLQFGSVDPGENQPGGVIGRSFPYSASGTYDTMCECPAGAGYSQFFYTTRMVPPPGNTATVNGTQLQFYKITPNVQFGGFIDFDSTWLPLPITNKPAPYQGVAVCGNDRLTRRVGNRGLLYVMIDRPFVGAIQIPPTKLFELFATTTAETPGPTPIANIVISGTVTVHQSCGLASGQNTVIDFGPISPSQVGNLSGPGSAVVQRSFQVECTHIPPTAGLNLSLESPAHPAQPSLLATGRNDLGIQVRNQGRVLIPLALGAVPGPMNSFPLIVDPATQRTQFELEAYPVGVAKPIQAGPFSATATLKFDFE